MEEADAVHGMEVFVAVKMGVLYVVMERWVLRVAVIKDIPNKSTLREGAMSDYWSPMSQERERGFLSL